MDFGLRLNIAASLLLAPAGTLGLRLGHLQIVRHGALESRAYDELTRVSAEAAPRADILDREGRILARSIPSWSCFVDKAMVKDVEGFAEKLSPVLGLPASVIARKTRAHDRFSWLKVKMDPAQVESLRRAKIPAVGISNVQERIYPNGALARGVLGLVGTEGRGLAGAELILDKRLRGTSRRFQLIRDGSGNSIYKSVSDDGRTPPPIRLTLDRNVQYLAEEALREGAEKHGFRSGYVAVQDPRSGEILAMAAWPANPLKNPLVQDAYEPGSTFKIVTALTALEENLLKPEETFDGEQGRWQVSPGVTITDHEPQGLMTLSQILEHSSNIGIAKVAERVGAARFYRASRALGFGGKSGVPLPGETAGELKPLSDLTRVGLAASSYGYGLAVSPLQILGAYSALANGGALLEPKLLFDGQPAAKVRRVAGPAAVREISEILERVVERGTAAGARIPGYRVAGKTGTARKIDPLTRRYSTSSYVASFVGFLPASAPRWTILVVLHEPRGAYYGGLTAAPIFSRLARRLLSLEAVAPDKPDDPSVGTARR